MFANLTQTYRTRIFQLCLSAVIGLSFAAVPHDLKAEGKWRSFNPEWKTSCGVDKGAIKRKGKNYVFTTSTNQCVSRGTFTQRSEIYGKKIDVNRPMNYMFTSSIRLNASSNQSFTMFQVHDGRGSCSPPLKLDWHSDNRLRFRSSYSLDKGVADCVYNNEMTNVRYSGPRLRRDGTAYKLQVVVKFDGASGFSTTVFIDGKRVMSGTYRPPTDVKFYKSTKYYLKHGVYSRDMWKYQFASTGVSVMRQKP